MGRKNTTGFLPEADFDETEEGIPRISAAELDAYAEAVLKAADPGFLSGSPDAVDIKKIFKALCGWHFRRGYLSRDGTVLGMAVFQEGTAILTDGDRRACIPVPIKAGTILVDNGIIVSEREAIYRFTICHEIGHALLHERIFCKPENMRLYAEQSREYGASLIDSRTTMAKTKRRALHTIRDWVEWQANFFASAILMPRSLIRKAVCSDFVTDINKKEESLLSFDAQIEAVSLCFKVSPSAALYRLQYLRRIPQNVAWTGHGPVWT